MQINISEAGTQAHVYNTAAVMRLLKAKARARESKVEDQIIFTRGRIKAILSVLAFDHVGARCLTDDGSAYFDLLFPYYVELAHLTDDFAFDLARVKVRRHMPALFAERGEEFFSDEWDRLTKLRSIAQARKDANPTTQGKGYLHWLPTVDTIKRDLNLTRARRAAVNDFYIAHGDNTPIRGIGTIDVITQEEVRHDDRARQTKCRRAKGVKSQSERRQMEEFKELVAWKGCSLSTIRRKDKEGILLKYLME